MIKLRRAVSGFSCRLQRIELCTTLLIVMMALGGANPLCGAEIMPSDLKHDGDVDFQRELLPILRTKCLACHNASDAESKLVLESPATMLKGGNEGPAVVAGKPDESLLYQLAAHRQEPLMPPDGNKSGATPLTPAELALLKLWIEQGAKGEVQVTESIVWKDLPAGLSPVLAVAQSPEGRYIAAGRGNQIWVYDVAMQQYTDQLIDEQLSQHPASHGRGIADLDIVQSLAFSADGAWIASGGFRTVRLWHRLQDARCVTQLPVSAVHQVAWSDKSLTALNEQGSMCNVDRETGEVAASTSEPQGHRQCLAVSRDGRFVASVHDGTKVQIQDNQTQSVREANYSAPVLSLCFVNDQTLAGGAEDCAICLWTLAADGSVSSPRVLTGATQAVVTLDDLDADHLVSGGRDGELRRWSISSGATEKEWQHGAPLTHIVASPQADRVLVYGDNSPAKLWKLAVGELVAELSAPTQLNWRVDQSTWSRDVMKRHVDNANQDLEAANKRAADEEASLKKTQEARDKADQECKQAAEAANKASDESKAAEAKVAEAKSALQAAEATLSTAPTDEAKQSAQAAVDAAKQAVPAAENELKPKVEEAQKAQKQLADKQQALESTTRSVETSEKALADARAEVAQLTPKVAEADVRWKAADAQLAEQTATRDQHRSIVVHGTASADGKQFATVDREGNVALWNAEDGRPLDQRSLGEAIIGLAFHASGRVDALAVSGRLLQVDPHRHWTLACTIGSPDGASTLQDRVTSLCFSADGTVLAVGGGQPSRSGELDLYRVADGQLIREIDDAHSDTIFGLAFSPDGKLLASCGADRFMKVFDAESGRHVRTFEGHTHHVLSVSWRADGRVLATGSADKSVKLWNFADGSQLRTIQGFGKEVTSVQFAGASDVFYATCGDQNLYRCDMGGDRRAIGRGNDFLYVVSVDQMGRSIAFGGYDSVLRRVDPEGKQLVELAPANQ